MQDVMWLITVGFLAVGGLAFLMMLAGARHAVVETAEKVHAAQLKEEEARREAEREAASEQGVYEATGVD
ncbi:MAG: hypothetical protein ABII12_05060 [Planctomycetota bacterium]